MEAVVHTPLLASGDPAPVEFINPESPSPVLLVCEHAGRAIPAALGDLGVAPETLASHRGWDIGAETVARRIAAHLGAPLVVTRYSRLVIDANRPPRGPESIPAMSDAIAIPANQALTSDQIEARITEIFAPYDRQLEDAFARAPRRAVFSIHSFTPRLGAQERPWHAGFLSRRAQQTAAQLIEAIARAQPQLTLAINAPYQISEATDWLIPAHAETRGLPHALIEIRNDQIDHDDGAALWADLLTEAIRHVMRNLS